MLVHSFIIIITPIQQYKSITKRNTSYFSSTCESARDWLIDWSIKLYFSKVKTLERIIRADIIERRIALYKSGQQQQQQHKLPRYDSHIYRESVYIIQCPKTRKEKVQILHLWNICLAILSIFTEQQKTSVCGADCDCCFAGSCYINVIPCQADGRRYILALT